MLKITDIRTDMQTEPLYVGSSSPAFSYIVTSDVPSDRQAARRINITLGEKSVFDTGTQPSEETLHIPYEGEPLLPYTRYSIHITSRSESGEVAEGESHFVTGPLGGISAEWIAPSDSCEPFRAYRMKKSFSLERKPKQALLYLTATNFFDVYLNGVRPDERRFAPAASPQHLRYFESYDLTEMMRKGDNTLGIILADGYYKPSFLWRYDTWQHEGIRRIFGILHLTYENGETETFPTDSSWLSSDEPALTENSIYHGEHYDARLETEWCDSRTEGYSPVIPVKAEEETVLPNPLPKILTEKYLDFTDARLFPDGRVILDFGQNLSGFVRIERKGKQGEKLTLRHSEMIDASTGELDTRNLRDAKQTDVYIYGKDGPAVHEPRFTYHGFRYVEVSGLSGIPEKGEFRAAFLHASLEKTLNFYCDDERIMRLFHNSTYSIRSNTMSYSTDCAGRDERTPCAMDIAAYVDFASFYWNIYDHSGLMLKHLSNAKSGNPEWSGAQIFMLRALYRAYGDRRLLEAFYPTARDYLLATASDTERGVHHGGYGDWCAPHPNMKGHFKDSFSHPSEIATALLYHLADAMCELAAAIGKNGDLPEYLSIMDTLKEGYHSAFYDEKNRTYSDGDQAPSLLPLAFGMVPKEKEAEIFDSLCRSIREKRDGHLDTGIFGTRYLATVLADRGMLDFALDTYFNPTYPSFADQFNRGASTLWEQWVEVGSMATHNHAMFAGACSFLTEKLFGLVSSENAYRSVSLRPLLTSSVSSLAVALKTVRGEYKMSYLKKDGALTLALTVPFGCLAVLVMPNGREYRLGAGEHTLDCKI